MRIASVRNNGSISGIFETEDWTIIEPSDGERIVFLEEYPETVGVSSIELIDRWRLNDSRFERKA